MNLTEEQLDALTEVVNIGVGRAAASLCELIDQHIALRVPKIRTCRPDELQAEVTAGDKPLDTSVVQDFDGIISGRALLAFPESSGVSLAQILGDQEEGQDELELDLAGILEEVGNIVLNAVLGSLANLFEGEFEYTVPRLSVNESADGVIASYDTGDGQDQTILMANAHFEVADSRINGSLLLAFSMSEMAVLLDRLIMATEC
ncbi:MAG: chemotaxis protein CheC [Planctomycetota bacterium]